MFKNLGRLSLAVVLAASTFAVATTAEARGYRDRGDDAAIAIGAGIVGLAIGAAIADNDDDRYYDRRYYNDYPDYYYYQDRGYYRGYPNRYYNNRHYRNDRRHYRNHRNYRGYDYREHRGDRRHYKNYNGNRRWRR